MSSFQLEDKRPRPSQVVAFIYVVPREQLADWRSVPSEKTLHAQVHLTLAQGCVRQAEEHNSGHYVTPGTLHCVPSLRTSTQVARML